MTDQSVDSVGCSASNFAGAAVRDTGVWYPLKRRLQCRMHVCKLLRIKSLHWTLAGKVHKCPLKSRLGKVRFLISGAEPLFLRIRCPVRCETLNALTRVSSHPVSGR